MAADAIRKATGPHTVMIIRHGEKPDPLHPDRPPFGQDQGGKRDPHSLTPRGWERADKLADLFAAHPVRAPFVRPDRLYAPNYSAQAHARRTYRPSCRPPTGSALSSGPRIRSGTKPPWRTTSPGTWGHTFWSAGSITTSRPWPRRSAIDSG